ncbi:hypothetical protein AB664_17515 [Brucella anthropi]|uniref:Uncharacterized protein n=1 Tax=Brucella anthropi TaxID=529 RepID=A0A656Z346_BRUAN|nr:hypothetical protein AB664_17515 [Brucella anthropi]
MSSLHLGIAASSKSTLIKQIEPLALLIMDKDQYLFDFAIRSGYCSIYMQAVIYCRMKRRWNDGEQL